MSRLITVLCTGSLVLFSLTGCDDETTGVTPAGTMTGSTTTGTATGTAGSGGTGQGGTGGTSTGTGTGQGGGGDDIPGGGTVLFEEHFDDANFTSRDWYDGPSGTIDSGDVVAGAGSFRCDFGVGDTACSAGKPNRHKFTASETVYLSMYLKFSANWVGSNQNYHPHMFHFINDLESDYVGPAHTRLTTYTEVVRGQAMLALQDSVNVDTGCIVTNGDPIDACDSYPFTEDRSVCSCNGIMGDYDESLQPVPPAVLNPTGRDCYDSSGGGDWYSSRAWRTPSQVFTDASGPYDKTEWHFVEVYFEMNSIDQGIGQADGRIRWVQDGELLISYDHILMRTGSHANLAFNQFAMLPYIGSGSPVAQSFWVDELTVATARP